VIIIIILVLGVCFCSFPIPLVFLFCFLNLFYQGCKVLVDCKDGKQYEGILHTINPNSEMGTVLRLARLVVDRKPTGKIITFIHLFKILNRTIRYAD
jgi:small nuclear ribonucleoprotein (snRNP)-like protein